MSNYKTNKNITLIDDLPYLDEIDNNNNIYNMIPSDKSSQIVQKFIRNHNYNPPLESGMNNNQQQIIPQQNFPTVDIPMPYEQQQQQPIYKSNYYDLSCVSVADHATNCVVCSRLYDNNNTGYVVTIILLSIICILLLKRVLNV